MKMKITDIKIPKEFLESTPSPKKVQKAVERYIAGTSKPLWINHDGELIDGYATLVAIYQTNPEAMVEVNMFNDYQNHTTTYVYGHHVLYTSEGIIPKDRCKEYIWRMPNNCNYIPQAGELVVAEAGGKGKLVVVSRTEQLAKCPINTKVNKVQIWGDAVRKVDAE